MSKNTLIIDEDELGEITTDIQETITYTMNEFNGGELSPDCPVCHGDGVLSATVDHGLIEEAEQRDIDCFGCGGTGQISKDNFIEMVGEIGATIFDVVSE